MYKMWRVESGDGVGVETETETGTGTGTEMEKNLPLLFLSFLPPTVPH